MPRLYDELYRAPAAAGLADDHLTVNALLEGSYMGDDAHQPVTLGQACQHPDSLFQRVLIQGAKALVEEKGVQPDAAGGALHLV